MVAMNYDIQLGNYTVTQLLSCEVRKSANKLSDTATIKLTGMAYDKALKIESKIKRGDSVNIKLGYDDNLIQEFKGYITSIATDNTIVIECEDGMFQFRKEVQSKQYKNTEAASILQDVVSQIEGFTLVKGAGVSDVRYDKFTISDATAFEVFRKIKEETGLHIFIKGDELHVHLKYTYEEGNVVYDYEKNVEKSSLKYNKEEDKKIQVEAIGIDRKNKKTKVLVGEKGGDKITIHRYNMNDTVALKAVAQEEIKKYRYTGYEGDITTWLVPYASYSYSANIKDVDYPQREGIYYVTAVTTIFDASGARRKISLGILLS